METRLHFVKISLYYSCETLRDKVVHFTKMSPLKFLEIILPEYDTQIYFFASSHVKGKKLERILVTERYWNAAATNSLGIKIQNDVIDARQIDLDNFGFIGKIKNDNHLHLKKVVHEITKALSSHFSRNDESISNGSQELCDTIDLTFPEDNGHEENDDQLYYENITSDIVEIDHALEYFYDTEITTLRRGWDAQSEISIKKVDNSYIKSWLDHKDFVTDNEEYERTLKDEEKHDSNGPLLSTSYELKEREDFLLEKKTTIPITPSFSRLSVKVDDIVSKNSQKIVIKNSYTTDSPKLNRGQGGNIQIDISKPKRTTKPIQSKLFSASEVNKWSRSQPTILHKNSTYQQMQQEDEKKRESVKNFKIPKSNEVFDFFKPQPRKPISSNSLYTEKTTSAEVQYKTKQFLNHLGFPKLERSSPATENSENDRTPSSIKGMISNKVPQIDFDEDDEVSLVISDDEDDCDISSNNKRRHLYNPSPKPPSSPPRKKFFLNREASSNTIFKHRKMK